MRVTEPCRDEEQPSGSCAKTSNHVKAEKVGRDGTVQATLSSYWTRPHPVSKETRRDRTLTPRDTLTQAEKQTTLDTQKL